MENCFGNRFKVTIYGESHAPEVGVKIEGMPKGITLDINQLHKMLKRRKEGELPELSSIATTPRKETDTPIIFSGLSKSSNSIALTTGDPIVVEFKNENVRPADYEQFKDMPRPSHADFVNAVKYGKAQSGGGISSGRMTLPLVAAGWVAISALKKELSQKGLPSIEIKARITSIYGESNKEKWPEILKRAAEEKDSVGAVIECTVTNLPAGIGEPFFNSLESILSHLILSIPGVKGIEFGNGFKAATLKGSQNNDPFVDAKGTTKTNNSGGINGGISNGNPLIFRVAVKPTSSIGAPQKTFNFKTGKMETLTIGGRHDVCFALRVPPIVEAVTAIAIYTEIS